MNFFRPIRFLILMGVFLLPIKARPLEFHQESMIPSADTILISLAVASTTSPHPPVQDKWVWQEPTDLEARDLFYGSGGQFNAPTTANSYGIISGANQEKYKNERIVEDNKGIRWAVLCGDVDSARAETTASRILWAVGYHVDQYYYIPQVTLQGDGSKGCSGARFRRLNDGFTKIGEWMWSPEPFTGSKEYEGLKTIMALLSNWGISSENNKIVRAAVGGGDVYYVPNLRSTLGKTAVLQTNKSKGNPKDYRKQNFVEGVENGQVKFHWDGSGESVVRGVRLESARWIGTLLGRLSDMQLAEAFRAGGFSKAEASEYIEALHSRIAALRDVK